MAIYKMVGDKEKLKPIEETSFGAEGVMERGDLQRILRDQPDVLEEGLLIISEEFGNWQDSNRRIDLLGLDTNGRLVVIELKRGDTGNYMDLQAIRYAAMVANMTYEQVVSTYQAYLDKPDREEDAEARIREHLRTAVEDTMAIQTEIPRIILASENFGKELTTCVMWLNDSWLRSEGQEIKCIRIQPHRNGDELLVETSVVIPLPEASDYQTQVGQRGRETRERSSGRAQYTSGGEAFEQTISLAQDKFHKGLKHLYDCAVHLEQKKLAELSSYINPKGDYFRLDLKVSDKEKILISFNNLALYKAGSGGEITFHPGWNDLAPKSLVKIDQLVGPAKSPTGIRHRNLSRLKNVECVLAVIQDAYLEANASQEVEG